jgi:hypothetical protein
MATISAAMLTAISSGVSAPIGRPIGACNSASAASGIPASCALSLTTATLRRLPINPT